MATSKDGGSPSSECLVLGEFSETEGPMVRLIVTASGITLHQYPNWRAERAGEYDTLPKGKSIESWLGWPLDQFLLRLLSVEPLQWCKEWAVTLQIPFASKPLGTDNTLGRTTQTTSTTSSMPSLRTASNIEKTELSAALCSTSAPLVVHVLCVYFSLLDLQARGYQRSFVLAFLTHDARQLSTHLSSLRHSLGAVVHHMRRENERHCLRDLEQRLADLQHTQRLFFKKSDTCELTSTSTTASARDTASATAVTNRQPPPPTLVPPTPNTTAEVLKDLKALHHQLHHHGRRTMSEEGKGERVMMEDDGEVDDDAYHSAEDNASGSDKERSASSSVSSLDDDTRQLYELTQSRSLKNYTPQVLKSLLCCTPVTLQNTSSLHLRALPELLGSSETYHTIVEELRLVLRAVTVPHVLYHLLEYQPFEFGSESPPSSSLLRPGPSSLVLGRNLLLSFNLHATLHPPATLPRSLLTFGQTDNDEQHVRYFEACLWVPLARSRQHTIGQTLLSLLAQYPTTLQTLVFSLLKGRPVIIYATDSLREQVTRLVEALSFFVVGDGTVVPWLTVLSSPHSAPVSASATADSFHSSTSTLYGIVNSPTVLTLAYLTVRRIRLLGLSSHVTIPPHLYQYVTVWRLPETLAPELNRPSKERISRPPPNGHWTYGPPYNGSFLPTMLQTKKQWPDPLTFLAHVHSSLQDLAFRAYQVYHLLHLGSTRGKLLLPLLSPQNPSSPRSSTPSTPQQTVSPATSPNRCPSPSVERSTNTQHLTKFTPLSSPPPSQSTLDRPHSESALPPLSDSSRVSAFNSTRSSYDPKALYQRLNLVDNDIEIVEHMIEVVKEQQLAEVKGRQPRAILRLDYSSSKKFFVR